MIRNIMRFFRRTLLMAFCTLLLAVQVSAENFASEVLAATFKLFHPTSTATCFLVRREAPDEALYLVTAAHSLEQMKSDSAIIVLRKEKDGSFERHDFKVPIRHDGRELWTRHEKEDVAVLRITEPLPFPVTGLPMSVLADEATLHASKVEIASPLIVLAYPHRFEANSAGFPVARQGIFASPPLLPVASNPTFLADFTTFSGDSGGPVFLGEATAPRLIVGIVLAQFRHDERVETEQEERVIHHPLGLGKILHAQYIRDTLEAAAASGIRRTTSAEAPGKAAAPSSSAPAAVAGEPEPAPAS